MQDEIENAALDKDSVGGIVQTAIVGVPVGVGEPMFSSLESELAKAIFSIGGVKGIEFGLGFGFASKKGSEVNDAFVIENDKVVTKSNNRIKI